MENYATALKKKDNFYELIENDFRFYYMKKAKGKRV